MKKGKWDFSGWATRADQLCSDGRTIRRGAFKDCDGLTVPLVWNHNHSDPSEVLGHALLEDREEGTYAYCSFNGTEKAQDAKELVQHGDIVSLSIYANKLKQSAKVPPCDVYHGMIREVSLVLAGANPGAYIENVITHGDTDDESAEIYHEDDTFEFFEEDDDEQEEVKEEKKPMSLEEELKHNVWGVDKEDELSHEDKEDEEMKEEKGSDKTVGDVLNTLNDEQKAAVGLLIEQMLKDKKKSDTEKADSDEEEESNMKHNVFDKETNGMTLSHSDMEAIFRDAKRLGSLKDAVESNIEDGVLSHAVYDDATPPNEVTYGIANIDYLFPDARKVNNEPDFISREMSWVKKVINGTHHTPFSRVKSMHADITMDEARAKGYIKGNLKTEEVFKLLKRSTDPQTIYKRQKMDRDDIIDIVDFDVVAWIKGEMRMMLEEEIARAILIGDGRSSSSDDHISEDHVRPIFNDADLYTVKVPVTVAVAADDEAKAKAFIKKVIKSRKLYKGSGNPTLFTTEDWLTEMLLLEDQIGHKLYKTEAELATALRVKEIVTVEPMENMQIAIAQQGGGTANKDLIGVIVNLNDYNVGADKGGQTSFFEDFDIDYNQQKYLYETRMSGALIKPYSAMSLYLDPTAGE